MSWNLSLNIVDGEPDLSSIGFSGTLPEGRMSAWGHKGSMGNSMGIIVDGDSASMSTSYPIPADDQSAAEVAA